MPKSGAGDRFTLMHEACPEEDRLEGIGGPRVGQGHDQLARERQVLPCQRGRVKLRGSPDRPMKPDGKAAMPTHAASELATAAVETANVCRQRLRQTHRHFDAVANAYDVESSTMRISSSVRP